MFKNANSKEEQETFQTLWGKIAKERKYPVDKLEGNSEPFILKNKDGVNIGTIEFVPCSTEHFDSTDGLVDIRGESRIIENLAHSYHVRKMGVKKEFASKKVLLDLLKMAATHAKNKKVKFYVSYLEKRHYEKLIEKFKFRIDVVGDEVKFGTRVFVPCLIDVEDAINNTQGYPLHIKSIVYMVRGTKKVKSLFY
ncbi:hypothetical protein [Halalkalibacter alkaliphilus]|uniref:Uncharacterized protein n=1 Tax=Halalkalibacter alkaliphilus TaxID=2917993 RepID=A0A9X2CTM0_9BACI|nr:hypothetical protein [Halalkalibacter alkaliphilus]MCL7748032.1 hypothetical protein [Halalkalibacter alkaliphilus]